MTFFCAATGLLALCDGFYLGAREESRFRYGRVVPGIVVERLSSTGEAGTRTIGGRGRGGNLPTVRTSGFDVYESSARFLLTGTTDAWVIDYRFSCSVGRGTCYGRDFVSPELWRSLAAGGHVNVRQADSETGTGRLDENAIVPLALVKTAMACVLFAIAWLSSGGLRLTPPTYLDAPDLTPTSQRSLKT